MVTLVHRREKFDDAWFGEMAYFLASEGVIRSNLSADFLGREEQVFVTHKLWVLITALWIKIWGFSLYTVKMVALPFVILQAYLFYRHSRGTWMLTAALYASCGVVVRYTFVSRPELAMAALGFLSWLALRHFGERQSWSWLLVAALSAGTTALFHLQGGVYMSAGALWLLWCKQYRAMLIYSGVSLLTFSLYFTDVVFYGAWEAYIVQTANDTATHAYRDFSLKLSNLARIPGMMTHTLGAKPATLLTGGCLVLRRIAGLKSSDLEKYLLLLALCFVVLANRITHQYLILFIPFMLLYCVETLYRVRTQATETVRTGWIPKTRWWTTAPVLLYFVLGLTYDGELLVRNLKAEPLSKRNARLQAILGGEPRKVIAPQSFIFGNLERLHIIGLNYYFHYRTHHAKTLTPQVFFEDARGKGVEAVIFEKNPVTAEYEPPWDLPGEMSGYRLIYRDERYRIYRSAETDNPLKSALK